ncbi:MAG: deoxyribose-phosphate aldolase [Alcaligenaceae bacterium]|jgi:deoxyribose-phosphate aldolase|nr:deoxyribose-phosphate aldolase [Alcaligenaceae bacterium]
MELTKEMLAKTFDETLLDPLATKKDIEELCERAKKYNFASVAILPCNVAHASACLKGSNVKVCAAVGFPLGSIPPEAKASEAADAVENGADEVDMVMNIGALKAGCLDLVKRDIEAVVAASKGKTVKVIIEISLLTEVEAKMACILAGEAGADYVKSSTGFKGFPIRPTSANDVQYMRRHAAADVKVKAAGGIRTPEDALAVIKAGADRIGTSSGAKILEAYEGSV